MARDKRAWDKRREFRAALNSAKIQMVIFHGTYPFDWPRCRDDAPPRENFTEIIYAAKAVRAERANFSRRAPDLKTISGAQIEHHSRAAACCSLVPPTSSCRPSDLRTRWAGPKA
jgi:hypothetical protein